jgi:predicted phosphodiesterase
VEPSGLLRRVAVLSDVHGNLEALRRVEEDIDRAGVDRVVCLGDVASYNADQHACMEAIVAKGWDWIAGNHDLIAAGVLAPINCGAAARYAASKAKRELTDEWRTYVLRLPLMLTDRHFVAFHASPRRVDEYIRTEHVARETIDFMRAAGLPPLAFFGHTHTDCVWSLVAGRLQRRVGDRLALEPHAVHLVNVGSVGEPRDGRACATYVVFDASERTIEFRRLDYDHRAARRKAVAGMWRRAKEGPLTRAYDRAIRRAGRLRHRLLPLPPDDSSLEAVGRRLGRPTVAASLPYRCVQSDQPTFLPGLAGTGAGKLDP